MITEQSLRSAEDIIESSNTATNGPSGEIVTFCAAARTLAVSIVGHLDLQASQTSIPVELTVIPVGLPIAATHWPLVGLTALEGERKRKTMTMTWQLGENLISQVLSFLLLSCVEVMSLGLCRATLPTLTSMHRQLGSPFSLTAHSLPAPQNTLAHTLLLLCSSWKKVNTLLAL